MKWNGIGTKSPYGTTSITRRRNAIETERSFAIASSCSFASMIDQVERSSDLPKTLPSTPILSPSGVVTS